MRVGVFSPMPPAKSGIADYSAALLAPLARLADVKVFDRTPESFDPSQFDVLLYQLGNNSYHEFVYQAALEHPGVVVMHEANLHYLVADLTIRRGDWAGYLREAEYNGGVAALERAKRVQQLEVGPDYEGLSMTRRVLERARAVIVHSACVEEAVRAAGFAGPLARIPHGAWISEADRQAYRERLGLDEHTPLLGVFGFLKPYKRIPESLRAFRRLVRLEPRAKLILAGEPHPDLPVHSLIRTLGLAGSVRVLGHLPIEDFVGYLAACDIVLNLRYPTVGETSGSLLRALGLGRPTLVTDVGSFRDFPDDICLKVRVDASEEDQIFEYLSLLVSRPEVARALGARARSWVSRECNWELAARRYASFLEAIAENKPWAPASEVAAPPEPAREPPAPPTPPPQPEDVSGWAPPQTPARSYVEAHLSRLAKTLEITPPGSADDRLLEMGSYLQITPALKNRLCYGEVRGAYYGRAGAVERREVVSAEGERFVCDLDLFDAERDPFPYPDAHFATVLCCELIEHLVEDPMHMMCEINRIVRTGGHLVLTTPNIGSLRAIAAILQGYHPGFFPQYIQPTPKGEVDPRHSREYTPLEVRQLLEDSGFEVLRLETGPFREQPHPELAWVRRLLESYSLSADLRDEGVYALGRKTGSPRSRYPAWLYSGGA